MSSYRDDINDTAVAADETWGRFRALAEDTARMAVALLVGVVLVHTDGATASDEVIDRARLLQVEQAAIGDEASGTLRAADAVVESGRISESVAHRVGVLHTETAAAGDELVAGRREHVTEGAAVSDEVFGVLRTANHVIDVARARDALLTRFAEMVDDNAAVGEAATGRLRASGLVSDTAALSDELVGAGAAAQVLTDTAQVRDEAWGVLRARDLVSDEALIEDHVPGAAAAGQAWTANTENWAMSRYAPWAATSAAVIDGVVYVTTADGVYALDGEGEAIEARLRTGQVDVGRGRLARPISAYLEYELAGTAAMEVAQTQRGAAPEAYRYALPAEDAAVLTNGRFMFGRGLRGRHFTFELTLSGQRAYINDLSVLVAPIQRRI